MFLFKLGAGTRIGRISEPNAFKVLLPKIGMRIGFNTLENLGKSGIGGKTGNNGKNGNFGIKGKGGINGNRGNLGIFGNLSVRGTLGNLRNFGNFGNFRNLGNFGNLRKRRALVKRGFFFVFIAEGFLDILGVNTGGITAGSLGNPDFIFIVTGEWCEVFLIIRGLEVRLRSPEISPKLRPYETCT
uniref:Uncharacterized protein n=1 Tax=Pararge aegeria TaxID=116150 RepID=S4PTK4_9NEOP